MKFSELHNRIRLKLKDTYSERVRKHDWAMFFPDPGELVTTFDLKDQKKRYDITIHSQIREKTYGHFFCQPDERVEDFFEIVDHARVEDNKIIVNYPGHPIWSHEFDRKPDSIMEWDSPPRWIIMEEQGQPRLSPRPLSIFGPDGEIAHILPPPHSHPYPACSWGMIGLMLKNIIGICDCGVYHYIDPVSGKVTRGGDSR